MKSKYISFKFIFTWLLIVVAIVGTAYFFDLSQLEFLRDLVHTNLLLFVLVLLFVKSMSIIYPPLPGSVITGMTIPLIGWELAYLIDVIGSFLGTSVAFFVGRKYGTKFLELVLGKELLDKVLSVKIKKNKQIEAAIILRIASGGILSDGLAWGASLIGFRYILFIIGYLISHLITTLPIFFLISLSTEVNSFAILAPIAVVAVIFFFVFKGRYLE